ncbi:MAG: DUF2344 domain-containing protein [Actinobacteria bacterium]|nr:DUF2344 domain-containing protein [Actinomycetota bacterium]
MRARIRFSKLGKIRFTSHRDLARVWERALRRAELPVAYSQGFSPHPKLHFGLALSTGHESVAEYLDVDLVPGPGTAVDVAALPARLAPGLPPGVDVQAAAALPEGAPSLQQAVTSCTWSIEVAGASTPTVADAVERLLGAKEARLRRERKGKAVTDDVRPAVLDLGVSGPGPSGAEATTSLLAHLATQPRGLRPGELVAALSSCMPTSPAGAATGAGAGLAEVRVCRLSQWIERDGAREEPLPLPAATSAPHARMRAS